MEDRKMENRNHAKSEESTAYKECAENKNIGKNIGEKIEERKERGNGYTDETFSEKTLEMISEEAYQTAKELIDLAKIKKGELLVVGCSTSEVAGKRIGKYSSPELGKAVFDGIYRETKEAEVWLVAQCCEHLNRALILPEEAVCQYGYEMVNVMPQPKAGGSFATAAWNAFEHPTAVEHIRAHAGIDIGDTLIGMHLRDVAVPVRLSKEHSGIGEAHVVCARTRPKFIGGIRAIYDETRL